MAPPTPDSREYTFFSAPHNTYTRIDYILISGSYTQLIDKTIISPVLVCDQACINTLLVGSQNRSALIRWCFNNDVLSDPNDKKKIENAISDYLKYNDLPETNPKTLWDVLKATLRSVLIEIQTKFNKSYNKELIKLEQDIKQLEISHTNSLNNNTLNLLTQKKYEYNKILSE